MKRLIPFTIAACIAGIVPALAQMGGGGGNTGRPSYDNPRLFDRDAYGNETYYPRDTYFGPGYEQYKPCYELPCRKTVRHKTVRHKKKHYSNQ